MKAADEWTRVRLKIRRADWAARLNCAVRNTTAPIITAMQCHMQLVCEPASQPFARPGREAVASTAEDRPAVRLDPRELSSLTLLLWSASHDQSTIRACLTPFVLNRGQIFDYVCSIR